MTEEQLNKEQLRKDLKGFSYSNEFLDKILELLSEQYINGLEQSRFDKRMLEFENQELKKQLEEMDSKLFFTKNELEMRQKSIDNKLRQQKEFIEYLETEKDRLARECSPIYEDGLGKTRLVSEDIFNEINDVLSKYKEIVGGSND